MIPIKDIPTEKLVMFFRNQPKETFMYFNPHAFDAKTTGIPWKDGGYQLSWKRIGYCHEQVVK